MDLLLYSNSSKVQDAELKGEAKTLYAIINLVDYLYSTELRQDEPVDVGTRV